MNRMLIAFVAIIAIPVAASAGVPNEEADVFLPVKPKVASAKRLPWQELPVLLGSRLTAARAVH